MCSRDAIRLQPFLFLIPSLPFVSTKDFTKENYNFPNQNFTWTVVPINLSASTVIGQSGPGDEGTNLPMNDLIQDRMFSHLKALIGTQREVSACRWAAFSVFKAHLSKNAIGIHQNTKHLRSPALPMLPLITTSHILQLQSPNYGENKLIQSNRTVPSIHTVIGSTPAWTNGLFTFGLSPFGLFWTARTCGLSPLGLLWRLDYCRLDCFGLQGYLDYRRLDYYDKRANNFQTLYSSISSFLGHSGLKNWSLNNPNFVFWCPVYNMFAVHIIHYIPSLWWLSLRAKESAVIKPGLQIDY